MGKIIIGIFIYFVMLPIITIGFVKELTKDAIELGGELYNKFNAWMDK